MFEHLDEAGLLATMCVAQRGERVQIARRVLAAGRLTQLRMAQAEDGNRQQWCLDNWEATAAEVGAELGISRGRASSQMHHGVELLERLPRLGALFAAGEVDYRIVVVAVFRTGLITDPQVLAEVDEQIAGKAARWNAMSRERVCEIVDWIVCERDPDAVRVARSADVDRHVGVGPGNNGIAELWGRVRATDAAAFDRRLGELAATVCRADPRTTAQRRADALGALAAGAVTLTCTCEGADCPARAGGGAEPGRIVIHLIAEAATVTAGGTSPGYLPGFGAIPAQTVRELAAGAKVRPVLSDKELSTEPHYRPSQALADFIRCRDVTCRFPGCDRRAEYADIDHTVPYPLGPTHPSNLKLLCRVHHLLKTFWSGPGGWADRQFPDGTVEWTSPSGRTYVTKPGGALFFPQFAVPTEELHLPANTAAQSRARGLMMPTRRRTRAQDRAARIQWERGVNVARCAANPPPF